MALRALALVTVLSTTVLSTTALLTVVAPAPAWAEGAPVTYSPPVAGPIADPYRAPADPYAAGNRGVDYATSPGEPVHAVADGEVTFAGQVGGQLHVVTLHADGVRSSLSFVATVLVTSGQRVARGEVVARAGASLHLGARRGETYLDPTDLLAAAPATGRVHLVPADPQRPLGASAEGEGLRRFLRVADRAVTGGGGAAAVAGIAAVRRAVADLPAALVLVAEAQRWIEPARPCTPAGTAARPPVGRRRVVLVGGLGSSSTAASVHDVDTAALGYAPADVRTFSYRGGDVATTPYGPADTFDGVDQPAVRLRSLVDELVAAAPGVPVDLVAHSMGGLVVRAALARPPVPAGVGAVVTLGTPHGGAALAGVAQQLLDGPSGPAWRRVADLVARSGADLDPASLSVRQLAPGSELLRRLAAGGPPRVGGPIVAVGARTDLVVPLLRSRWPGQRSTGVDVGGPPTGAHAALPGSQAAARELGLAVAGRPPTCRSTRDRALDALAGLGVEVATTATGGALDPVGFVLAA